MFAQVSESGFWHCVTEIKDSKREARKKKKVVEKHFYSWFKPLSSGFLFGIFFGGGLKCHVRCCWQAAYEC